jgi:hypothetical protein
LTALWGYIVHHDLHESPDPGSAVDTGVPVAVSIRLNKELQRIFGTEHETLPIKDMMVECRQHLAPADPIAIKYVLRVDAHEDHVEVFDVPVLVPDFGPQAPFHMNTPALTGLARQQQQLTDTAEKLSREATKLLRRRHFLDAFRDAPLDVCHALLNGQVNEVVASTQSKYHAHDEMRRVGTYSTEWIPDAIDRYLQDHVPTAKRHKPEDERE